MLFTGRLTADAEVNTVKGDRSVTNFTVALNQRYKTKAGEKKEKSVFVDCTYWLNPKFAPYLKKGAIVEISGWVEAQAYQNKKEEIRGRLNYTVNDINLFSTAGKTVSTTADTAKKEASASSADDLPF
jgi:single-strand DNA-binding protein